MINKQLIYDLNRAYSDENLKTLDLPTSALPKRGVIVRLARYFIALVNEMLFNARQKKFESASNRSVMIIYATKNQKKIADKLAHNKRNFEVISFMSGDKDRVSLFMAYLVGVLSFPVITWFYITEKNIYQKRSYQYNFDQYLLTYGAIIFFENFYKIHKPLGVVNSNDHSMINRVSAFVAKKMNIKTIYLQHASVTDKFPPLNFDAVFLDGLDSFKKYSVDKSMVGNIKIYLSGSVAKGKSRNVNKNNFENILICTNTIDQVNDIAELVKYLVQKNKYGIVLRSHPGDTKRNKEWLELCYRYSIAYDDPRGCSLNASFSKIDIIISGESNIILDAALVGITAILYSTNAAEKFVDYYGFIKNGLALQAFDLNALTKILDSCQAISINHSILKYYDASIGSRNVDIVDVIISKEIYKIVGVSEGVDYNSEDYWELVQNYSNVWTIR